MTHAALFRAEPATTAVATRYLGPAEVTHVRPHELELRLPTGAAVRARVALGYAYEAQKGDEVLAIGEGQAHYVIGILASRGRAVMAFPGDVELRAVGGALRLTGDLGVAIEGREVSITAGALRMAAGAVVQRFTSLRQKVTELFRVEAGQAQTIVEGASVSQSKSATIVTEEKVSINGREIHLG